VAELLKNNKGIQVLTDTGWSNFAGIINKGSKEVINIITSCGEIKSTPDHNFFDSHLNKVAAKNLSIGDKIIANNDVATIISINVCPDEPVYDLVEVENNHRFYANNLLVSNCEFIINDETLINATTLVDMEGVEPLYKTGQVRWYKEPQANKFYVVALDPSLGTGGDPAAIQVFEANTTIQVAEWKHNKTPIPTQIRILNDIVKTIYDKTQDATSIYYSIENNTIGEAALISLAEFGEDNFPGMMLSEPKMNRSAGMRIRKGFNTTNKSKLSACAKLKNLVETKKMTVNSKSLISEFKTFVAHGTSYAAKIGETDDLVMATVLAVRMMQVLQNYHADLNDQIKDFGDEVIEPMPFIMF